MPTAVTIANIDGGGAADHRTGQVGDHLADLGKQAHRQEENATGRHHPPAANLGQSDQSDVLRERGVRKGVGEPGQDRRQAVGGQTTGQVVGRQVLPTSSPTASMSAVDSVYVTKMTMHIVMIAAAANFG